MKKKIGERLAKLRGTLPRKKVCEDLGIPISTLQSYENGDRIPRDEKKILIADYYHRTVQEIFFD